MYKIIPKILIQVINNFLIFFYIFFLERHRRSKHEQEGRIYACDCGKSFLSQPALNNHKKTKHPELLEGQPKRGRGRPRKYPAKSVGDFESTKYDNFFSNVKRANLNNENYSLENFVQEIFNFLYQGEYKDKLFSKPNDYKDNFILKNLAENIKPNDTKNKNEKSCDDVFYEYLYNFRNQTNKNYFSLLTKFVLLFRECYDISKNKDNKDENKKPVTDHLTPEGLPDLCNEFYGEFMEPNNFFGINDPDERAEIIEIIQHFCIWLFKNEYTKSKLSLASN